MENSFFDVTNRLLKMAITIATYSYLNLKHYYFYLFKQPKKLLLFRFPEANITLKAHRDDPEREAKWKSLGFIPYKAGTIQKLRLFNYYFPLIKTPVITNLRLLTLVPLFLVQAKFFLLNAKHLNLNLIIFFSLFWTVLTSKCFNWFF